MDDTYFSDKKKKDRKDEPSPSKRIVSDNFVDADYNDEKFELNLNNKNNAPVPEDKRQNFKVNIPEFDIDIPKPGHITAPSKDIYSSGGVRTPKGRRMAPSQGQVQPDNVPQRPVVPHAQPRPAQPSRIPQGQRQVPARQTPPQQRSPQGRPVKKKSGSGKVKIALGILGVFVVFILGVFLYGYSALGGLSYDDSIGENIYLKDSELLSSESVRNILFIGSDAREGLDGQRSDSMILFSIDTANREIKLTSFLRDSYVYIPSKGYSTKLNAAFNYGGAQLLMDTIEYNFGVDIDDYVMVNYDVFIELVDLLGGITIHDVTEKEAKYMREEVNSKKFKEGTNHIGGRAAMWYCRIRYVDNDFGRTQRQRKVLTAIISKAAKTNPFTLIDIVKQVLPNISTSIDRNGLLSLGVGAFFSYIRYDINQQQIPAEGTWSNARINGQDVLKMDFSENKEILKEFIYG